MAGVKGRSGPKQEKPFRDALMLAIKEAHGEHKKLRAVAESLVERAIEGDVRAITEVADRLDGKPAQAIVGDNEAPLEIIIRDLAKKG
jgi:hypothetical protein